MRWHGYPIPDDAIGLRPWWRQMEDWSPTLDDWPDAAKPWPPGAVGYSIGVYLRTDGARIEIARRAGRITDDLDAYDRAYPLPVPPALCGQVWAWPADGTQGQVIAVRPDAPVIGQPRTVTAVFGAAVVPTDGPFRTDQVAAEHWPPACAVLVAGPGSPWAPLEGA
jgi:hypothetical protein